MEHSGEDTAEVYWSVVRGPSAPTAAAVEPGEVDVQVPDEVMEWAEGHGLSLADDSVYLLVADEGHPGGVPGQVAWMSTRVSREMAAAVAAAIDE